VAVTIWGGAEGSITIIAASIPVLRALIRGEKDRSTDAKFDTHDERRLNTTSLETLTASTPKTDKDVYIYGAYSAP
jgi:hypothetical protein